VAVHNWVPLPTGLGWICTLHPTASPPEQMLLEHMFVDRVVVDRTNANVTTQVDTYCKRKGIAN
jgi:hypothetical protein